MSLGLRLKRLRENRKMSVKDLASAIGVSRSFVYQLERDEVSPSYSTLRGVAQALGTTVSVLVGDMAPEEWLVVKATGRKRLVLPGGEGGAGGSGVGESRGGSSTGSWRLELMPFLGSRNRRMQPVYLALGPRAKAETFPFEHEREDLFFVTEGEVVITVDGGRELVLGQGDSAYLLFETVTAIENRQDAEAGCLWVVSPSA